MKKFFWVLGTIGFFLGLVWVDVYCLEDSGVLVPSAHEVTSSFLDYLRSGHYDSALNLLSKNLKKEISVEDLKKFKNSLELEFGKIQKVNAEKSEYRLPHSIAIVKLKTSRGVFEIKLPAIRESGLWRISGLQ